MIGRLPPVGQRVPCGPREPAPRFPGFDCLWLNSGTAALALAIGAALRRRAPAREVILPAYGCPDLVAAAVRAGALPVLVDCTADDPGFDLERLDAACNESTAAVVAVNFLGVRERLGEIRSICDRSGSMLVEDCAQWYPEGPDPVPVDARVLSFGRGKPVNLLGGGALLLPEQGALAAEREPVAVAVGNLRTPAVRLFNLLLGRRVYGLVSRLPGLGLGETRYRPLERIARMDESRQGLLGAAVRAWTSASRWREARLASIVTQSVRLRPLPALGTSRLGRLLRYPVLAADPLAREFLCRRLQSVGASPFYGAALPELPGVLPLLHRCDSWAGARRFAATLFTLPLHAGVDETRLGELSRLLREFSPDSVR